MIDPNSMTKKQDMLSGGISSVSPVYRLCVCAHACVCERSLASVFVWVLPCMRVCEHVRACAYARERLNRSLALPLSISSPFVSMLSFSFPYKNTKLDLPVLSLNPNEPKP